jgi:8-oxo-dGTP diphosphatase
VITQVAVGILRRFDGQVLLAQRPAGKPYAGWWEFPGGKCEAGESTHHTLVRELSEELGITVTQERAWLVQDFVYPHATVQLHFHWVTQWQGQPQGREQQALAWSDPRAIGVAPLLPASIEVIRWLGWPQFVPLGQIGQGEVSAQSCQLIEEISWHELEKLSHTTHRPIYIRGTDPQTGQEGYLSSLIWL